ncbi:sugar transferase [Candidatus Enterovibrio altilux]|uniref:sugar transferase n=1 Tax=Candidatus Enterovibrio altilux TaxID=1927128 RepID=UPI000BBB9C2E|nr:sugar transferase [Candidatus Enterovibrio luxaltus]
MNIQILQPNTHSNINPTTAKAKRTFDIILTLIGLGLTLPIFPLVAIVIKLDSPGSIFFYQIRIGRLTPKISTIFRIIKFRTMCTNAESKTGATWATDRDSRITRVGHFLRKTRLDELPQFFNVLRGDMSLIGPRPERPGFYQKLENEIPYFADRTYFVTPGITGLAQINQGYDTCIEDVRSKVSYDHSYALSLSSTKAWLQMDCYIIFKTMLVMLTGSGQ